MCEYRGIMLIIGKILVKIRVFGVSYPFFVTIYMCSKYRSETEVPPGHSIFDQNFLSNEGAAKTILIISKFWGFLIKKFFI